MRRTGAACTALHSWRCLHDPCLPARRRVRLCKRTLRRASGKSRVLLPAAAGGACASHRAPQGRRPPESAVAYAGKRRAKGGEQRRALRLGQGTCCPTWRRVAHRGRSGPPAIAPSAAQRAAIRQPEAAHCPSRFSVGSSSPDERRGARRAAGPRSAGVERRAAGVEAEPERFLQLRRRERLRCGSRRSDGGRCRRARRLGHAQRLKPLAFGCGAACEEAMANSAARACTAIEDEAEGARGHGARGVQRFVVLRALAMVYLGVSQRVRSCAQGYARASARLYTRTHTQWASPTSTTSLYQRPIRRRLRRRPPPRRPSFPPPAGARPATRQRTQPPLSRWPRRLLCLRRGRAGGASFGTAARPAWPSPPRARRSESSWPGACERHLRRDL